MRFFPSPENPVRLLLLSIAGAVCLSGCGGGSAGGGTDSGQSPDPVTVDLPVAYVQRPIPVDGDGAPAFPDIFAPGAFNPGGELFIKARATAQAQVVNVTKDVFKDDPNFTPATPNYDVKDVAAHPAGKKLVFSLRAPEDPELDDDEQPTWNIWEYNLETKSLRRIISSDFEAEKGDDVSPHYLADGRILFSSSRQKRSKEILLDEGKPQFGAVTQQDDDRVSFLLHSMKDDGTDIQQLSYNQSHDIQPTLMADGRIVFTRWEGTNPQRFSFYTAKPDGTDVQRYFGYASLNIVPEDDTQTTARLFRPLVLADGRVAAIYMQNELQLGGDMVVIDGQKSAEGTPGSLSIKPVDITLGHVSRHGRFAALAPLYDGTNRLLVSWSQCRLQEIATAKLFPCLDNLFASGAPIAGYREAPAFYGVWIYDLAKQAQQPVVLAEDGKMFSEVLALENLAAPPAYIKPETDPELAAQHVGILHIRSVYDFDGIFNRYGVNSAPASLAAMAAAPANQRPARFVRLLKAVSVPDDDTLDAQDDNIYGNLFNDRNGIQEILGYAPVEPDGSVKVKVPADVAFTLEVLDASGKQISANHTTLLQVRPGETRECNGCHVAANTAVVHGRGDLQAASINTGAAGGGQFPATTRYDSFGTPTPAEPGETMAQFASRTFYQLPSGKDGAQVTLPSCGSNGARDCKGDDLLRTPSVDLVFNDEWSNSLANNFAWRYNDLIPASAPDDIPAPTPSACRADNGWDASCRIVINYEYHIQPLWERTRPAMTVGAATATSCLACHAPVADIDGMAAVKVPDGQLDLTRVKLQANARMASYIELTANDNKQIVNEETGLLEDELVPNGQCNVDINGNPIVDGSGVCTDPVLVPVPQPASMSRGGARNSGRFFNKFAAGGSHAGYLNPSELKLLSEWLDTSGRYYTNPFEMAIQNQ